jgi:membrane protein YdbS with pleckstrin-like domain
MYNFFRDSAERLLRIPPQPTAPAGDEASQRVFRAAPAFYKYRIVIWALGNAFAGFFVLFTVIVPNVVLWLSDRPQPYVNVLVLAATLFVLGLFLLHALVSFAILRLDYEKRWYLVTDRSLRIREGVLTVREMTITFANIQNLSVTQGPIQRALGIADLKVETAGGGRGAANKKELGPDLHTAWFRGIDNAPEVKELIQHRLRALKDSGLGHHEEAHLAVPARGPSGSAAVLGALRALADEARALRLAASRG